MHEIRIAEDLSAIVLETAMKENLSKVTMVNVSFGELVQIVPDIFKYAFQEAVRNTVAQETEVDIEIIGVRLKCRQCNREFDIEENRFVCNNCNSTELEILNGKELFIKSIEGE